MDTRSEIASFWIATKLKKKQQKTAEPKQGVIVLDQGSGTVSVGIAIEM
jgi:hypothetical protein